MPFPATRDAMEQAGYKRTTYTRCRGCSEPMEFWHTPGGKWLPMNPMPDPDSPAVSHYATCKHGELFRNPPQPAKENDSGRDLVEEMKDILPRLLKKTEKKND